MKEGDEVVKLLSLFSGIGAFEKALTNLEIPFELIAYGCIFMKTEEVFDLPEQVVIPVMVTNTKEFRYFMRNSVVTIEDKKLIGDTRLTKRMYARQLCGQYSKAKLTAFQNLVESTDDGFGFIPFFRLDANRKLTSHLQPVKALIDDYDLMACGLSNNLQDVSEALYVVKGFQGDNLEEMIQNVKTKKHIGVEPDGDVDIKTVDLPHQARIQKLDIDEKNIYRFGMGFNACIWCV